MSNLFLTLSKSCALPAVLFGSLTCNATAQEAATDAALKGSSRPRIQSQRPDSSRGWVIVSKESYWPLCYEPLDRIEEAMQSISGDGKEEAAEAFDKCSAWLKLAASAAMTDGTVGVMEAAYAFQDAADGFRDGTEWTKEELSNLITLGLVTMAKSHVLRAEAPDLEYKAPRTVKKTAAPSASVKEAEADISKANAERAVAQYRYDTIETSRHLNAAQEYLSRAGALGNFTVDPAIASKISEPKTESPSELTDFVDDELRPRISSMKKFIEEKRNDLAKKLGGRL